MNCIRRTLAADYQWHRQHRRRAMLDGFYGWAYALHQQMQLIRRQWAKLPRV